MIRRYTIFNQPSERFKEPIDWSLAPPDRGFWTDQEMFTATTASSMRPIKSLQRRGLLTASKFKENGKWHRAWTIGDLIVIQLAEDLANGSRFGTDDVAEILRLIPNAATENALLLDPLIDEVIQVYTASIDEHGIPKSDEKGESFTLKRADDFDLIIADRRTIYAKVGGKGGAVYKIGYLSDNKWLRDGNSLTPALEGELAELESAVSVLYLKLSRMGLLPIEKQFGVDFEFKFVTHSEQSK